MATQTLVQAQKFINDEIVRGVVEDLIDLNPWFASLPFDAFTGQSVVLNMELDTVFDAATYTEYLGVGGTILAKDPMQYVQYNFLPTKIIGDVHMDDLVQATSASDGVDQTAVEISSKTKGIGRRFESGAAIGDGAAPNMNGLLYLVNEPALGNAASVVAGSASPPSGAVASRRSSSLPSSL